MKLKHLLEAISLIEWKEGKLQSSGLPFYQRPHWEQLTIRSKADWLLEVVKKAKEIEDENLPS